MRKAILRQAEFYGSSLSGANLEEADLSGARFDIKVENNQIYHSRLDGTTLHKANLSGSFLAGAILAGADLSQGNFSGGSTPVTFVISREVVLTSTTESQAITLQAKLTGANLSEANFQASKLASVNLQGTNLSSANFRFADLQRADLSEVNLSRADLRNANLRSANLDRTNLSLANLIGANLAFTSLANSTFQDAVMISKTPITLPVDISYEDFFTFLVKQDCTDGTFLLVKDNEVTTASANVYRDMGRKFYNSGEWRSAAMYICATNLSYTTTGGKKAGKANFAGVNLTGADLSSTDLSGVTFEEVLQVQGLPYTLAANLTNVICDEFTLWPPGFLNHPPCE